MLIRRATPDDEAAIRDLHDAAFATGADGLAPEALLVDLLRAAGDVVSPLTLVADVSGTVVGHVVCSPARIGELPSLGLGPLGVLPDRQRQGVGKALMHAVLAAADALGHPEVVLLGDPGYYRQYGFTLALPLGVIPPDPRWHEHFQLRALTSWTPARQGDFRYAPAFEELGV